MRPSNRFFVMHAGPSQRGLTTLEMLLAGFMGLMLLWAGGYLYRNLVREYLDIRDQVRIQSDMKSALQAMTRQIANMGALLPDPLEGFSPRSARLDFAYTDVPGRFCPPGSRVSVAFYAEQGGKGDRLMQTLLCKDGNAQTRQLAATPPGALRLSFRYLDGSGTQTLDRASIKSVELTLALETGPARAGRRFEKTREQVSRIQCMNL
jgi:Tfp pilus assembly protein PilW